MGRAKLPRKSTNVDMTAMCDVAFLLLSFFILTTKFKPDEALAVTTPSSVSTKVAEQKDVVLITIDKEGKVYFSVSDDAQEEKEAIIESVDQARNLGLSPEEKKRFTYAGSYVGVSFNQLKSYLQLNSEQAKGVSMSGIPIGDSINNELTVWVRAATSAFQGTKMNLMVKGDGESKYPSFKGVVDAFKKNEQLKFQLITDQEGVPEGTDLHKTTGAGKSPA